MLDPRLAGCLVPEAGGPLLRLPDTTRIGRTTDNDITLDDPRLSRHHATITHDGTGYRLADLDSMNGTFLNKRRISRSRPLREGDCIRMGDTRLVFRWLPLSADIQSPATDAPQAPVKSAASLTEPQAPVPQATKSTQEAPPSLILAMILLGLTAALLIMAIAATVTYIVIENWPPDPSLPGGQITTPSGSPIATNTPFATGRPPPELTPSPP